MIKVFICGINGKMGRVLKEEILEDPELELVGGYTRTRKSNIDYTSFLEVPKVDVLIDFSVPSLLKSILDYATINNVALVLGTTGYDESELKLISDAVSKIPIIYLENYSLGINAIRNILSDLTMYLANFEINLIEKHHKNKLDSPSGTAKLFEKSIDKKINMYSIRTSNIVGEHTLIFNYEDEEIEITHRAYSKRIFALGAIKCAKLIYKKKPYLYTYNDLVKGVS